MKDFGPEVLDFIKEKLMSIINESDELDKEESEILKLRYGLAGEGPYNIKELSKKFNTSQKKMKDNIERLDKKIFNILKREI